MQPGVANCVLAQVLVGLLTSLPPPERRKVLAEFGSQINSKVEVVGAVRLLSFVPPVTYDDTTINPNK